MQELFSDARTYLALAGLIGFGFAVGRWVGAVNSDRTSFKEFMALLRADVQELRRYMVDLHKDVEGLRGDVRGLRGDVEGLRGDIAVLRGDVREQRGDIKELFQSLPVRATPSPGG